jgi:anti-sigma factor (TIGR02949 family)
MAGRDCDDLLQELSDYLHGDLSADRKAALHEHLEDCPPCFETADFQEQLRRLIAKRCCEQVPEGLRLRIEVLLAESAAFTEHDPTS